LEIGVDIVSVSRIRNALEKFGTRFLNKILTTSEQDIFNRMKTCKVNYLARRFASKEALIKAFGTKKFLDFEVLNYQNGKPYVNYLGKKQNVKISISDEKEYAIAFVIKL
jgi:holo-[acyl-carrier protein] synthase